MAANVGSVSAIRVVYVDDVPQQGSGYVSPQISFEGGGGSGATATATLGPNGSIVAITPNLGGDGYVTPPNVIIEDGANQGSGAVYEAVLTLDSGESLDFPQTNSLQVGSVYTAENGIAYEVVALNPTIWRVVDVSSNQGQRLWFRNTDENSIQPIFPGDDVNVVDTAGNATTRIFSGGQQGDTTELPGIKSDNYFFDHLPPLVNAPGKSDPPVGDQ